MNAYKGLVYYRKWKCLGSLHLSLCMEFALEWIFVVQLQHYQEVQDLKAKRAHEQ